MKRLLATLIVIAGMAFGTMAKAQNLPYSNVCTVGAKNALTSGLPSSNLLLSSYTYCLVTVYNTGTTNKATIFSSPSGATLGNPFYASAITGQYTFYAGAGSVLDITMSEGNPSPGITNPYTFSVSLGGGGGSGGALFTPVGIQYASTVTSARLATAADTGNLGFGTDTGGVNNYVVNLPVAPVVLQKGMTIYFVPNSSNTSTAPTVVVSGISSSVIVNPGGAPLLAGDIAPTMPLAVIQWNGTNWVLQNPLISGQLFGGTAGKYALWLSSSALGSGHLDETTNSGFITSTLPVIVNELSVQATALFGVGTGTITIPSSLPYYTGWTGPVSGTIQDALQLPNTAPTEGQLMAFHAPSSVNGISQAVGYWETVTGAILNPSITVPPTGNWVVLYPHASQNSGVSGCTLSVSFANGITATGGMTAGNCLPASRSPQVIFNGYTLADYGLIPSQVVAVEAAGWANQTYMGGSQLGATVTVGTFASSYLGSTIPFPGSISFDNTYATVTTSLAGTDIATAGILAQGSGSTCGAIGCTGTIEYFTSFAISAPVLLVEYTGTATAAPATINIAPGLLWNAVTSTLSTDQQYPYPALYDVPYTVAGALSQAYSSPTGANFWVVDGTSATDCTTGGGTINAYNHFCYWNGGSLNVFGGGGFSNPMTTAGDIIYGGTSGAATRLGAGTAGYTLYTNGTGSAPYWAAAGGCTTNCTFTTVSANGTHTNTVQSAQMAWNLSSGQGETDFVNYNPVSITNEPQFKWFAVAPSTNPGSVNPMMSLNSVNGTGFALGVPATSQTYNLQLYNSPTLMFTQLNLTGSGTTNFESWTLQTGGIDDSLISTGARCFLPDTTILDSAPQFCEYKASDGFDFGNATQYDTSANIHAGNVYVNGCPDRIGQVKLASAAANITFSSIPSGCTSLELVITGQTANSSQDNLYVNFNSDTTGGHYDWGVGQGGASIGATGSGSTASSSILIGLLPPSSSGRMGSSDCIIPLYSATTFSSKAVTCGSSGYWDSSNNWHVVNAGGDWNPSSAAAITSIVLTTSSASNFPPGTTATLYGKP